MAIPKKRRFVKLIHTIVKLNITYTKPNFTENLTGLTFPQNTAQKQ